MDRCCWRKTCEPRHDLFLIFQVETWETVATSMKIVASNIVKRNATIQYSKTMGGRRLVWLQFVLNHGNCFGLSMMSIHTSVANSYREWDDYQHQLWEPNSVSRIGSSRLQVAGRKESIQ